MHGNGRAAQFRGAFISGSASNVSHSNPRVAVLAWATFDAMATAIPLSRVINDTTLLRAADRSRYLLSLLRESGRDRTARNRTPPHQRSTSRRACASAIVPAGDGCR